MCNELVIHQTWQKSGELENETNDRKLRISDGQPEVAVMR